MLRSSLNISHSMDYFSTLPLFFLPKTYSDFDKNVIRSYWGTEQKSAASAVPYTAFDKNDIKTVDTKIYSFSFLLFN